MAKLFKDVAPSLDYPAMEQAILDFWRRERIFHRSLEAREGRPPFVFYEGPPTANGRPGVHHVLSRAYKDVICRFNSMDGYFVERKAGWDTHGLPVELEVERELGLEGKPEIEEYGIERFNEKCRESVLRYTSDWESLTERIGYWVDMEDAYVTFTNEYIESVWWTLKALWDKGLMYEGYKVVPYCPRCGTSLSSHEVAQGYELVEEPSVFIKVRSADEPDTAYVVWTTTPWTLPGNVALAVHPNIDYAVVSRNGERLILAEELIGAAFDDGERPTVEKLVKGSELVGRRYQPIFDFFAPTETSHRVVPGDFVTAREGTGIVHIAPAYGEDDMNVGRSEGLPVNQAVDLEGRFKPEIAPWAGQFVKEADPHIIEALRGQGNLIKVVDYEHTYPFCWRCHTPLLYFAKSSWFIETTAARDRLVELNKEINWVPAHIKEGRFGNWLEGLVDWALSRERYWGTPLPIWRCEQCDSTTAVGSIEEMQSRAAAMPDKLDLHRPYVDEVVLRCEECSGEMRRVSEVIDAWYDSGAMPYAQWHYPSENKEKFEDNFPASYISEAIDQTRGWFFSLHALSTLLFDSVCYRNVICLGHILDEQGEKMSKHKGNVIEPWTILTREGADPLRWYLFWASPAGSPKKFSEGAVLEVLRKFLLTYWNTYSFFVTYANIDGFDPREGRVARADRPALDQWVLSRLEGLIDRVGTDLRGYSVTTAARAIGEFVDDLSNWYVRRSRRRFWKGEDDGDKAAAYHTLYEALLTVSKVMAPFTPFITEEVYRNLTLSVDPEAQPSVHMSDFPQPDRGAIDSKLEEQMAAAREIVVLGRAARTRSRVKIRQPLPELRFLAPEWALPGIELLEDQIRDELNVRRLVTMQSSQDFISYAVKANFSLLGPKYGKLLPRIDRELKRADALVVRESLVNEGAYRLHIDGESIALSADEIFVEEVEKEEYVVETENGFSVALSTAVTPELRKEGLARELVHFVQALRKEAGFEIADYIRVGIAGDPEIVEAVEANRGYVEGEVLARELSLGESLPGHVGDGTIDGRQVRVGVERLQGD